LIRPYPPMNKSLPPSNTNTEDSNTPLQFLSILTSALSIRTRTIPQTHTYNHLTVDGSIPRIAVLFSGGLDCSVLAWIIHTLLPPGESIDLINVAFENPRFIANQKIPAEEVYNMCPDRITGHAGWEELCRLSKSSRQFRFIEV
jgi:hypothetical protein